MKLNEVFKPLFESAYNALEEHEIKSYHEEINAYAKRGKFIYRGLNETDNDVFLGVGSRINRSSANTHSFVNTIIDVMLPEWDEYPDRLKSFICTANPDYAEVFGITYHVIPLDNQPIGVCPTEDFWGSFAHRTNYTVQDLNDALYEMFKYAQDQGFITEEAYFTGKMTLSAEKLEEYIRTVDKFGVLEHFKSEYREMFGGATNLWKFLSSYLNPSEFKLVKYPNTPTGAHEMWMSGNVLFVNDNYLQEHCL